MCKAPLLGFVPTVSRHCPPRPMLSLQFRDTGQSSPQGLLPTYGCQHSTPCQFLLAIGHCSSGELTFPMASQASAPVITLAPLPTDGLGQVVWYRGTGVGWFGCPLFYPLLVTTLPGLLEHIAYPSSHSQTHATVVCELQFLGSPPCKVSGWTLEVPPYASPWS